MSARKAISTKHALHYVLKRVYEARNKDKMLTTLLLNIMNVFNNVIRRRLLHNFKAKRINIKIIRRVESYLNNKVTILKINEHITKKMIIKINISQRFFLSLILFLFYNAILLKKLQKQKIMTCEFVDDVALLVEDDFSKENCNKIIQAHDTICMS